ncbi:MAG TPA: head GIN domain-containing protein [Telluria sp.]|nr:head GIN domain-containing protein [Telluria sp.]
MRTLLSLAAVVALSGCAIIVTDGDNVRVHSAFSSNTVVGNGTPARDERAVLNLSSVDAGGALHVEVRVGQAPSLVVEADSNLLPLIRTEASGDKLRIYTDGSYRTNNLVRVIYTVPQLNEVKAHGSGRIAVSGLNGGPLKVRQSGSGAVELSGDVSSLDAQSSGSGRMDGERLTARSANLAASGSGRMSFGQIRGDFANISVSGAGSVFAAGSVRTLTARVSGSGSANLERLASEQADLGTSGAGGITANVTGALVAQGSGAGGIRVYGRPAQRTVNGSHIQLLD